ncbi:MAG: hypothetical protein ACE14V_06435 [bacterium]
MVQIKYPIENLIELFKEQVALYPNPMVALEQSLSILGQEHLLQPESIVYTGLPLGSLNASGKFRQKVYATRNGKTHIRKLTIPFDPKTPKQQEHRAKFKLISESWIHQPLSVKEEYNLRAKGLQITGYALYLQEEFKKI